LIEALAVAAETSSSTRIITKCSELPIHVMKGENAATFPLNATFLNLGAVYPTSEQLGFDAVFVRRQHISRRTTEGRTNADDIPMIDQGALRGALARGFFSSDPLLATDHENGRVYIHVADVGAAGSQGRVALDRDLGQPCVAKFFREGHEPPTIR